MVAVPIKLRQQELPDHLIIIINSNSRISCSLIINRYLDRQAQLQCSTMILIRCTSNIIPKINTLIPLTIAIMIPTISNRTHSPFLLFLLFLFKTKTNNLINNLNLLKNRPINHSLLTRITSSIKSNNCSITMPRSMAMIPMHPLVINIKQVFITIHSGWTILKKIVTITMNIRIVKVIEIMLLVIRRGRWCTRRSWHSNRRLWIMRWWVNSRKMRS